MICQFFFNEVDLFKGCQLLIMYLSKEVGFFFIFGNFVIQFIQVVGWGMVLVIKGDMCIVLVWIGDGVIVELDFYIVFIFVYVYCVLVIFNVVNNQWVIFIFQVIVGGEGIIFVNCGVGCGIVLLWVDGNDFLVVYVVFEWVVECVWCNFGLSLIEWVIYCVGLYLILDDLFKYCFVDDWINFLLGDLIVCLKWYMIGFGIWLEEQYEVIYKVFEVEVLVVQKQVESYGILIDGWVLSVVSMFEDVYVELLEYLCW